MPSDSMKLIVKGQALTTRTDTIIESRFQDVMRATIRTGASLESTRGAGEIKLEASADDVLEVTLEDGLVLYTTVERFDEEFMSDQASRGKGGELVIPQRLSVQPTSRGLFSFILKAVGIVDVETAAAESIASFLKDKIESKIVGDRDALYALEELQNVETVGESNLKAQTQDRFDTTKPILLFIHGTASSTTGSFAALWENTSENIWDRLSKLYPQENLVGFEHHTLGLSPIENAVNLIEALPPGARLHVVSHSRGGIVGELICRGQLADEREPFSDEDLGFFSKETNTRLADLIKIISSGNPGGAEKDPYSKQREQLVKLNSLFKEKSIKVERFVRVACPASGTTLASNKLDMYLSALLNIVGYIPLLKGNPVYGLIKSLLLVVVKQKSQAEQIPGLEAQMPGSPTIQMLNNLRGSSLAPLAVIEGDIEPKGIFKKIALLLVDRFYESDHDLVVNTPSMDGGTKRRFDIFTMSVQGGHVNHFSYFANDDTRLGILDALRHDAPSSFTKRTRIPKVIARSLPRGKQTGDVPAVFIVPGILGSELAVGDDHVWVDKLDLLWGGFGKLSIDSEDVMPVKPLESSYGELADYLKKSHEVIPFAYDWRKPIKQAAAKLAEAIKKYINESTQPVRFIAHSMGGLVVRSLIAEHPDLWNELCRRDGSRVLMLGTPNDGSYSMVRVLLGQEKFIKYLALADFKHSKNELLALIREFPGLLELLPRETSKPLGERTGFYSTSIWGQIESVLGNAWRAPIEKALQKADTFWKDLEKAPLDKQRVFYVAGRAPDTPIDIKIDQEKQKVKFFATAQGDGRVPWDGGIPDGIQHWFVDAQHGDLANYAPAFSAIAEIIETGATQSLSTSAPVSRGGDDKVEMPDDRADYLPNEESLTRAALGSAASVSPPTEWVLPPLSVSVKHGDLCFVDKPVAVGHYIGDGIVSAEAALDNQLRGRLRDRYDLRLYPGPVKTHEIVLDYSEGRGLRGAIVVGLGDVGMLTPGNLTASVRAAVLSYALKVREELCFPDSQIKLASLLIGSGSGGITVDSVLNCIIKGVLEANRELAGEAKNIDRTIRSIEFIELYEDRAGLAQHHLNQIAKYATFWERIKVNPHVKYIEGGLRRPYELEQDGWWPRIRIETRPDGALNFTVIAEGARVPMEITATQRYSVEPFLKEATSSVSSADKVGRVLFELLVPANFKHHAPENRDLVFVVDENSAKYPWELMEYPTADGDKPLAGDASVIRQLAMADAYNNTTASTMRGEVVIIADPDLQTADYPQLPGAEKEGKTVAALFTADSKWKNPKKIIEPKPTGVDIIRELMTGDIRILHIAAHGVVNHKVKCLDENKPPVELTGVLIGKDHVLTAAEIKQMPSTPQLAFINCCYLGKVDGREKTKLDQPNLLAANFGVALIQRGVRAVVVAGWEVQDDAAEIFAKSFYTQMLDGQNFGGAVKQARAQTQKAYPQFNTWGAYQCYGDPGFRLVDTATVRRSDTDGAEQFVSLNHCIIEVENIFEQAKTITTPSYLAAKLNRIVNGLPSEWQGNANLHAILGKAWGELGKFDLAIGAYETSARAKKPAATISDLEQLANFKARYALELDEAGEDRRAKANIHEAVAILKQLNKDNGETIERLNLLGSAYKRQAIVFGPESDSRVNSLTNACEFYRAANELALQDKPGRPYAYSVINLLSLWYLLRYYGSEYKIDRKKVDGWISKLKEGASEIELNRETFWEAITGSDLQMLEAMLADSLHTVADDISTRYADIRHHGSSPRQFNSVMEHLRIEQKLAQQAPVGRLKKNKMDLENNKQRLVSALDHIITRLSS